MDLADIQNLLIQIDDTREQLFLEVGRVCGSLSQEDASRLEGFFREFMLLQKMHLHAVSNGTVPASLVAMLAELQKLAEARSAVSEAISAPLSPALDLNASEPPASVREEPFSLESSTPPPLPATGDVF